ncbi:MAG: gliding motility lipoprotein GldH, partial [Chitinophagales bacterium]
MGPINIFRFNNYLFFAAMLCLIISCEQSRVFDKNIPLNKNGWNYGEQIQFEVNVNDTIIPYNLYVNVRHTDEYPYDNLWVKLTTVFPDSTSRQNEINVKLSEPDGKWTGNCVDGICFNSVLVQNNFLLPQKGKYIFILE